MQLPRWTLPSLPRRAWWALGAGGAAIAATVLIVVAASGPLVRARVASEAARRHLEISVGEVHPGWFDVRLGDVHVRPSGVEGVEANLREVDLDLGVGLGVREVAVRGGAIALVGSADELARQLREWRGERAETSEAGRARTPVRVEGLSLDWREARDALARVEAHGIAASRDDAGAALSVETARVREQNVVLDVAVLAAKLDAHGELTSATVSSLVLGWESAPRKDAAPSAAATASEPAPPPLPVAVRRHGGKAAVDSPEPPPPPLFTLPDLHAWRARVAGLNAMLNGRVAVGATVGVNALSLQLREGEQRIAVGPGPFTLARGPSKVDVSFSTMPEAGGTSMSLTGEIPLEAGELVVSLAGGPIPLSLLGATDGQAGLTEVGQSTLAGKGRLALAANGDALTFDGEMSVRGLALRMPKLAPEVVRGIDVSLLARGVMSDDGQLRLDDVEASMGALRLLLRGAIEQQPDHLAATLSFDLPVASCQALLDSVPSALLPTVRGARMAGTLGGRGRLAFDTRKLDDLALSYDVEDRCTMAQVPEPLAKERFAGPFTHTIYLPDGTLEEEETGPTTEAWTDLSAISPFMRVAVLTTEDGAFLHHHGFNHAAIRSALVANIKARRFLRGASTITMQLAKNLFLTRDKTLSRKLEELILTDYLEQVFTKDEMMELYLNVIEFGPNVYGIAAAASHYFGRKPAELNLAESLFLSSLLPSPIRYHKLFEKGQLPDSWLKHVRDLMVIAEKTGKISPAELAQGLTEPIVFHDPKLPPPPARPPVVGSHLTGDGDGEWQELN